MSKKNSSENEVKEAYRDGVVAAYKRISDYTQNLIERDELHEEAKRAAELIQAVIQAELDYLDGESY